MAGVVFITGGYKIFSANFNVGLTKSDSATEDIYQIVAQGSGVLPSSWFIKERSDKKHVVSIDGNDAFPNDSNSNVDAKEDAEYGWVLKKLDKNEAKSAYRIYTIIGGAEYSWRLTDGTAGARVALAQVGDSDPYAAFYLTQL